MIRSRDLARPWFPALLATLCLAPVLVGCNEDGDGMLGSGQADLSWVAPSQRVNGERLSMAELDGYIIRYGQSPQRLPRTIEIDDPYVMERQVEGLPSGTWYFAIQSRDQTGSLSPLSAPVSKSIP